MKRILLISMCIICACFVCTGVNLSDKEIIDALKRYSDKGYAGKETEAPSNAYEEESPSVKEPVTEEDKKKETTKVQTTKKEDITTKQATASPKESIETTKSSYVTEPATKPEIPDKKMLTSEKDIVQGILDGFNYQRKVYGYEPVSFNETLSAECKSWATYMANNTRVVHSDMNYVKKYVDTSGSLVKEGVGQMNLEYSMDLKKNEAGIIMPGEIVQYESENYISYETAFAEGRAMCVHIGSDAKNVSWIGYGIAIGKNAFGAADYYTCSVIVYEP